MTAADFASATSSANSQLVHDRLRYLEHDQFRLVSEALPERETILKKCPILLNQCASVYRIAPFYVRPG
jgi:glycerol-3-phosphate dehydrogenase